MAFARCGSWQSDRTPPDCPRLSSQLLSWKCILVTWGVVRPWRRPKQSPPTPAPKEEGLTGQPARSRRAPAQRTSCLYFVRKHTVPGCGQGVWGRDRQGNCFPALYWEVGASTTKKWSHTGLEIPTVSPVGTTLSP